MRLKKLVLLRHRKKVLLVTYSLAERGQTPVYGKVDVPDGDVIKALQVPANQEILGLRKKSA